MSTLQDHATTTYDPISNLEWLDLSFTAGQSYQDVANGYGGYTTTEGYRFATRDELIALFQHAGGISVGSPQSNVPENLTAATTLLNLLGTTLYLPSSQLDRSWLFYDPSTEPQTPSGVHVPSAVLVVGDLGGGTTQGALLVPGLFPTVDSRSPEWASALVRVVPEPSSLALGLAALPLFGMRRRSRVAH